MVALAAVGTSAETPSVAGSATVTIVTSFVCLCVLLGAGHLLRMKVRLLQKLYLPSCVIAGIVGLLIAQCILATGVSLPRTPPKGWRIGADLKGDELRTWRVGDPEPPGDWSAAQLDGTPFPLGTRVLVAATAGWGKLPGFLINIVFACLFLGVALPSFRTLFRRAGLQLAYGQTVAWGQYVVGVGLFLFLIQYIWTDLPAMFGAIVPVGFEGGHGTASGMAEVFADFGWEAGKDFALVSATAGIVSAVVFGMLLINWAERRGHTVRRRRPEDIAEDDTIGVIPVDRRPSAGKLTVTADAIESFTLHVAIVGGAILIGYLLKQALMEGARISGSANFGQIARSFPLFPLCMLGGLAVQFVEDRFDRHKMIDLGLMRRIQNTALDFLVVAAIATIRIDTLRAGLVPLLIIVGAGILWNVFCVVVLAPRLLPDAWFERAIAEMGQSMGVTATGLLLLRVVDPDYESPAVDAFASKQLLHEPFMGGGLWTSAAVPLLAVWGGMRVFLIACGAVAVWLTILLIARALRVRARN